nr:DUF4179 domain-containing protein [Paenibacillus sp. ACRSA]
MRKTIVAATTVVVLGAGIAGTGFISPVMASTLQHIPLVGSIFSGMTEEGLKTALEQGVVTSPNVSLTHDGVTLQVTDLLFDGTRLSFAIERKGDQMPAQVFSPYIPMDAQTINDDNEWVKSHQVPNEQQTRGYVATPVVLINGEPIQFDESSIGDDPFRTNVLMAEYTKGLSLPDSFELTIRTSVTQISEPFEFKIPVEIDKNLLVIKPEATQSNGQFSYTVSSLEFTSATTRLVLDS